MSDNQPPSRGQVLHEQRDLDEAVLSGDTARVPASRRAAAVAMAALRSAPAPSELNGEAAARAAYRLFVLPDGGWPARTAAGPLIAAEPAGRPHSHRRVSRRQWRGRPAAALLGAAAAAAAAACVVAVVCALASSGGSSGQPGRTALATHPSSPVGGPRQPVLDGRATPARTPTPAATAAASSRAAAGTAQPSGLELCQQWASFFQDAVHSGDRTAERSVEQQLSSLARGGWILGYCAQFSHSPWSREPAIPQLGPGGPGPGGVGSGAHGELGAERAGAGSAAAFRG
jgi:hypothetical protein